MDNSTVKIDPDLLDRVKKLIREKSKRIRYSHQKQFVDVAVLNLLEQEEGESGNG